MTAEEKLESLGYPKEKVIPEGNLVEAVSYDGHTVYTSGQLPFDRDRLVSKGKVPSEIGIAPATEAAALCAANVLRAVRSRVGTLEKIDRVVRITGYVNSDPDFTEQHLVINGASQLVLEVFG